MVKKKQKSKAFDTWQRWEYKHTTFLLATLLVFILLLDTSFMTVIFEFISKLGYIGVFVAGILFVSIFTAVPAVALLISFGEYNPVIVALIAGLGSMIGDYIILRFAEDKVAYELKPIAFKFGIPQTIAYMQGRKPTLGLVRLVGALIIASPLPDEIGVGLLGLGKLSKVSFLAICYVLNAAGIFIIILTVKSL